MPLNAPTPTLADPERVFRQAASCELSANLLCNIANFSAIATPVAANSPLPQAFGGLPAYVALNVPPTLVPSLHLMPFAVELYLKCLIQLETKPVRGHDLVTLFQLVTPGRQAAIKQAYQELSKPAHNLDIALAAQTNASESDCEFDRVLDVSRNAFETWRYPYEDQMAGGLMMTPRIARCVRLAILELRPDWSRVLNEFGMVRMPNSLTVRDLLSGS